MSMKLTCGEFVGLAYANDDELREFAEEILAENAKLRELCEDMLDCMAIRAAFGRPPTSEMYERFADAARELGIEVS